jgi:hypothetical protein
MSIDPDVATTDQPYVFTNDDPLNMTDRLGLAGVPVFIQNSFAEKRAAQGVRAGDGDRTRMASLEGWTP